MSEHLKEVKRQFFEEGELSISGFEYLISQAERVQDLKIMLKVLGKQNQRYKQALEFYADKENYELWESAENATDYVHNVDFDTGDKARQVLQGGNDNE